MAWPYVNRNVCPLFTVCSAEPAFGEVESFNVTGQDVGGGNVHTPNVTAQIEGESTIQYPPGIATWDTIGFQHVNVITGQKGVRRQGAAESTAGNGLVFMCCVAQAKEHNPVVQFNLDYDALQGQGLQQYVAAQDCYVVAAKGSFDVGGVVTPRWGISSQQAAGPIDINLLDADTIVFVIWERV